MGHSMPNQRKKQTTPSDFHETCSAGNDLLAHTNFGLRNCVASTLQPSENWIFNVFLLYLTTRNRPYFLFCYTYTDTSYIKV